MWFMAIVTFTKNFKELYLDSPLITIHHYVTACHTSGATYDSDMYYDVNAILYVSD